MQYLYICVCVICVVCTYIYVYIYNTYNTYTYICVVVTKRQDKRSSLCCRNRCQGNGPGPQDLGAGGSRSRCLHHGPQGRCSHAGFGSQRDGGLGAADTRGQRGTDFPRRRREPTKAGAGETCRIQAKILHTRTSFLMKLKLAHCFYIISKYCQCCSTLFHFEYTLLICALAYLFLDVFFCYEMNTRNWLLSRVPFLCGT